MISEFLDALQGGREGYASLVDDVLHQLVENIPFEIGFFASIHKELATIQHVLGEKIPPALAVGKKYHLKDTYLSRLLNGKHPNLIQDARNDPRVRALPVTGEFNIGSYVSAPVYLGGKHLCGAICCISPEKKESVDDHHIELVDAFAGLLGRHLSRHSEAGTTKQKKRESIEVLFAREVPDILFQPIVHLLRKEIVGAEALARFPVEPFRPPDEWFADAWEVGLGLELEMKALDQALKSVVELPDDLYLAVNLSPSAFLSEDAWNVFDTHASKLSRIVIEITEHIGVVDYEPVLKAIRRTRSLCMKVAVDDVGAGYSGLLHLLEIKPDYLKLDISLTRDIDKDNAKQALVSAVVTFASRMGIAIIAEGVETAGEAEALRILGVALAQGYLFARPQKPPFELLGIQPAAN